MLVRTLYTLGDLFGYAGGNRGIGIKIKNNYMLPAFVLFNFKMLWFEHACYSKQ